MQWNKLSPREQRIVIIGVSVSLVLLYLFGFLIPTMENSASLRKKIITREKEFSEAETLLKELRALPPKQETSKEPILPKMESITTRSGVINKMTYLRPFKQTGAEIKLTDLTGNELIRFLHFLQRENMPIQLINLKDYEGDGLWVVKILVGG